MRSLDMRLLLPPHLADEGRTRTARLLNVILLALLAAAGTVGLLIIWLEPESAPLTWLVAAVLPLGLGLRYLMRRGRVRLASQLLVYAMLTIVTLSMAITGGVYSSSASINVIFIVAAALLLGGRHGIWAAALSIGANTAMLWAGTQGLIDQDVMVSPVIFWLVQSLLFVMAALLLYLDANSLKRAQQRANDAQQALVERNHDLEVYAEKLERREATLAAAELRYRLISELSSDYAYAVEVDADRQLSLIWMTDAFTRISGYQADEIKDMDDWLRIIEPADLPVIRRWIAASAAGQEQTCDYRIRAKDGSRHWLRNDSRPVQLDTPRGHALRIYGAVRDITRQKEAEEEQSRLLDEISRQGEALRALNRRLAEAQEIERKRLVQELHDQIGQNLTAIALNLNIVKTQVSGSQVSGPDANQVAISERLHDTISLVRQTTVQIRNVMADLRPPVLDDYGLSAALAWYAARIQERSGLSIQVQSDDAMPRLDPSVENALFRISQEGITNIVKHAQADCAVVTLDVVEQTLRLTIRDDGRGLGSHSPHGGAHRDGWGLLTMEQRAESIGGRFQVASEAGLGTRITVEVPL